ncbi:MAG: DUF2314 domain-containing protein [Bacteroidota bacterium]
MSEEPTMRPHASDENVIYASDADGQMNWAMKKARLTLNYFKESLGSPRPDQLSFSLKARIIDGEVTEHIWLSDVSYDADDHFYGTVNNEPVDVRNVQLGSRVGLKYEDVSDWLIVENGRLIGGYTIRAFRDQMPEEQKPGFDQSIGLHIDEGVDYFDHNMHTPEGAILCLEDAYTAGDLEAAAACKDFENEAKMMLKAREMPMGEEVLKSMAGALESSFKLYMSENGMPSFTGVKRAFPSREFLDEGTVIVTEICTHPDGRRTLDRLVVTRFGDREWRVGPPANDQGDS